MNFHISHLNWFPNWELKNREELLHFKGLSEDGRQAKFAENLGSFQFNKDLSNETTFSLIHLAGRFL